MTAGYGIEFQPDDTSGGFCDCCRSESRFVWGRLLVDGLPIGSYRFAWTVGGCRKAHPANFDLFLWADDELKAMISLIQFTRDDGTDGVSVIDAGTRAPLYSDRAAHHYTREDLVGTALARDVFAAYDYILMNDRRLAGHLIAT